jgi:tricorn protease
MKSRLFPLRTLSLWFLFVGCTGAGCRLFAAHAGYYRFPALHGDTVVFTAEGDLWKVGIKGGIARRLTTHPGQETAAAISPDGGTIAFSAEYEGPTEVYTMSIEGGLPVRHTFEGGPAEVVGWTPAGRILYRTKTYSTLPNDQLIRLDPEHNQGERVPLWQAGDGVFAPDARTLFFTRLSFQGSSTKRYQGGTAQNLWRFGPDQSEAVPLTGDFKGTSKNPMWWKGRVYFVSDRDGIMNLWSMNPDGTDLRQHTRHHSLDVKSASSSEGRIVYQQGADLRLYEIEAARDGPIPITLMTDFDQERERWVKRPFDYLTAAHVSPDGERVVLTARGQVFVAPVHYGRLVEVTRRPGVRYRQAGFFPDGKSLLALSDETGELEFWKLPANGVGRPQQLTTNGAIFRFQSLISPDGDWVVFQDKDQKLWVLHLADQKMTLADTSPWREFQDLAWSPDSQWLAYVRAAPNTFRQIQLYRPRDGKRVLLTDDRTDSYSPAWSRDGKWIYFLSDRALRSLVSSPWGPRQPDPFFDQVTKLYQVALAPGLRSPFLPPDELSEQEKGAEPKTKAGPKGPTSREETTDHENAGGEKRPQSKADGASAGRPAGVTVTIALEGLSERLEELPVPAGNYSSLGATAKHLYWISHDTSFDGRRHLSQLTFSYDNPKPKTFVDDVRSYELAPDAKKMLVRKGNAFYVVSADGNAPARLDEGRVDLGSWTFSIDPREEWRQIFVESWRMLRDYFYDPHLHGLDWPAARKKYLPLVERVSDRSELSDLISEMAGELSALHIFVRYGDQREGPDQIRPAALGARLERDVEAGGWRVDHIYRGDPDYPSEASPLRRPGVEVKEGDVILSINGAAVLSVPHPAVLLRNQAGKQVLLEVKSPGAETSRQVLVKPISTAAEADLRYDEWEHTRRTRVEELGRGQIGYVHLRAMNASNIAEWARDFYPVYERPGLIIDMRHNRGGSIDSWILGKLLRRAWFFWQPRAGHSFWNMPFAFRGHMVVLCNERTASDGESFTEGFRRLGMGKVLGTRTWGGEIWLSARRWLVDGGMATAAETGVYGPEGQWLIEGHGVDPDLVVDNLPHATFEGQDAQLEAAIEYLQDLIAKEPRPVPPHPPYPDKAFPK